MEALLCHEEWLSSPAGIHLDSHHAEKHGSLDKRYSASVCTTTKEGNEQALSVCLEKETGYMPEPHYTEFLESENLVSVRLRCLQWLFKSRSRWNLSICTVFLAANYLDRFISKNRCKEWKDWMVELLAAACLSVACKFNESYPPTLSEIQMEDLDHLFQSSAIESMELTLLQALDWRLSSPTAYSYIELFTWKFDSMEAELGGKLAERITALLLGAISDLKLMAFRPSVVAVCAAWCSLDLLAPVTSGGCLSYVMRLFNQNQKDEMKRCRLVMEAVQCSSCPQSPTSVLMKERIDSNDRATLQLSGSSMALQSPSKKRERERELV